MTRPKVTTKYINLNKTLFSPPSKPPLLMVVLLCHYYIMTETQSTIEDMVYSATVITPQ